MKKLKKVIYSLVLVMVLVSCKNEAKNERVFTEWKRTINEHVDSVVKVYGKYAAVKLPIKTGVKLWNPTAITKGPNGVMYAANYTGEIYSLQDTNGDGLEDYAKLYCNVKNDSLRYPTSMIFNGNKLLVGTTQEIRMYEDTNSDGVADKSETFFKDFPYTMHLFDWTFGLELGPDKSLYVILCTDSWNDNPAPDPNKLRGSILKISPDGKSYERYATGLRFAYGMRFNEDGDLFFSDNRGNENKYEELNYVVKGSFYGNNQPKYPEFVHNITEPLVKLKYGFAPVGIDFNPKNNDFDGTAGDLFISYFGPDGKWNEGSISRVRIQKVGKEEYEVKEFPVADKIAKLSDLEFGIQGDLYVAQFGIETHGHKPYKSPMGAIYRFIEADWVAPDSLKNITAVVKGNKDKGRLIFKERACNTCHSIDGNESLLGPDLMGIGKLLTKEEIIESINNPDKNIKTGFDQVEIKTKQGKTYFGRMVTSSTSEIVLMLPGNVKEVIKTSDVVSSEFLKRSLMPPGLLGGLDNGEIGDLVSYMQSLMLEEQE